MTKDIFVVAYEGDDDATTLDYAIERAAKEGASLCIVHVLEWSPYQFLTPEELEERHARRADELSRAKSAIMDPAVAKAKAAGLEVSTDMQYGSVVPLVLKAAEKCGAAMIFVGRSGSNGIGARIFGSVPLGLAQVATIPTVIVP